MTFVRAHARAVQKPWGSLEIQPWGTNPVDGVPVGELWYERPGDDESRSRLLLKLLVTTEQLSIQVHPDDAYAQSIGLPWGKTEAWYILSAAPGAKVAVGLKEPISSLQLQRAIDDGSVVDLIQWRPVVQDDVVFVPAGTIHTIGAGITIAEIQQRSDATFRVFDFGRGRELHVADAIAAADPGPAKAAAPPIHFTDARTLLIVDPHFVLERIDLPSGSSWHIRAERETWLYALRGGARLGPYDMCVADAVMIDGEQVRIDAGDLGLKCLAAYPGPRPAPDLLQANTLSYGANSRPAGFLLPQPGDMAAPPTELKVQP